MVRRSAVLGVLALWALGASAAPVEVPITTEFIPNGTLYDGPQTPVQPAEIMADWEVIATNPVVAVHVALLPGSDDTYFYYGRPMGKLPEGIIDWLAGVYEMTVGPGGTWRNVTSEYNQFCSGIVPTTDGKLLVVGGTGATLNGAYDGRAAIVEYDFEANPVGMTFLVNMTAAGRWYPTPTLMPDSKVLVYGGTVQTNDYGKSVPYYEVWNPETPTEKPAMFAVEPVFLERSVAIFYPFDFVLPTGDTWTQINDQVRFIKPDGSYRMDPANPTKYLEVTGFPADVKTQYPASGTAVMGPLTHEDGFSSTDIIVFGGSRGGCAYVEEDILTPGVRESYRIRVSWQQGVDGEWEYTFGEWEEDDTGIPRCGGDATLLPNADVLLTNGGQTGCPGSTYNGTFRRNTTPAFWPVLYQTDKPVGERVTIMKASPIARMYHNVALLTRDGKVLIAGCDQCGPDTLRAWNTSQPFWSPSSFGGGREYRNELFSPPYVYDTLEMPRIRSMKGEAEDNTPVPVTYDEVIEIGWTNHNETREGLVPVTRVALMAPSSSTHGWNNNQRLIYLEFNVTSDAETDADGNPYGLLSVRLPPNTAVAPPQYYLVFLLQGKTYSRSRWVHLTAGDAEGVVQEAATEVEALPVQLV